MEGVLELIETLESRSLAVIPTQCVAVRNRNARCRRCVEACPQAALAVEDNRLTVDAQACTGCGACAQVCPTAALQALQPSDAELLAQAARALSANEGVAVVACDRMLARAEGRYDVDRVAAVPCLARVDASLLCVLGVHARRIVLVQGGCEACPKACGAAAAERALEDVRTLWEAWGADVAASVTERLPGMVRSQEQDYSQGRRQFLSSLGSQAREAASVAAEHAIRQKLDIPRQAEPGLAKVGDGGTLPTFVPARHGRLLLALRNLGQPEQAQVTGSPFAEPVVDVGRCSSCRMCATFCPTGAISPVEGASGTPALEVTVSRCVRCGACEDICPTKALSLSDAVPTAELMSRGVSKRIDLPARTRQENHPLSIVHTMGELLGVPNVYER